MKIPVTIFSGFLGAGKTTLIGNLIRQRPETHFAVIVNEFGTASIDGDAITDVHHPHAKIYDITNALIGYPGDNALMVALSKIGGSSSSVDHVIVETSGLAVPTAIMEHLCRPAVRDRFVLDSAISVVDTPWLLQSNPLSHHSAIADVFRGQIAAADVIVLNKIDDLDHRQLESAEHTLRTAEPTVRFIELAHHAHVDASIVFGMHLHEVRGQTRHTYGETNRANSQPIYEGHSHGGLSAHEHGLLTHTHVHEHDPGWLSFKLDSAELQSAESVQHALEHLCESLPVLRAKGHIRTKTRTRVDVQCVRQRVVLEQDFLHNGTTEHEVYSHSGHEDSPGSELVFIGYDLDRATVSDQLCRLTSTVWA